MTFFAINARLLKDFILIGTLAHFCFVTPILQFSLSNCKQLSLKILLSLSPVLSCLALGNLFNTCSISCGTIPHTLKTLIKFSFFRLTTAPFNSNGIIYFGIVPLLRLSLRQFTKMVLQTFLRGLKTATSRGWHKWVVL